MIVSAFGDEIAPRLDDQLAVLTHHGIRRIDMRGIGDRKGVMELSKRDAMKLREALRACDIEVATIASPIGKEPADVETRSLEHRMARIAMLTETLDTPLVRVFGFRPPVQSVDWREASLRSLRRLVLHARAVGITLLLENERGTWADTVERFQDLLDSVDDPHLQAVYDPANALRSGEKTCLADYERLKPHIRQLHVKDLNHAHRHVPAGHGCARWPELLDALRRDRFEGILSLEPHLAYAGPDGGFTGPEMFGEAVRALRILLDRDSVHHLTSVS
jgi:L-ribulose-5-phosphate 3-epimerase